VNPSVRAWSPVRDQGRRSDLAADADPEDRHHLVAEEADQPGQGNPAEMVDGAWVDRPAN